MITIHTLAIGNHTYEIHMMQETALAQEARIHRAHPLANTAIIPSQADKVAGQLVHITDLPALNIQAEPHALLFEVSDLGISERGVTGKIQWCGQVLPVMWGKMTRTWFTVSL